MLQRDTCRQRRRQCSGSRSTAFGGVRRQGSRIFACALRSRHRGVDNNVSQEVQSAMERWKRRLLSPMSFGIPTHKQWVSEYYELPEGNGSSRRCRRSTPSLCFSTRWMTRRTSDERPFTFVQPSFMSLHARLTCPYNIRPSNLCQKKDHIFPAGMEAKILKKISLKGILGIKNVFMREDNECADVNVLNYSDTRYFLLPPYRSATFVFFLFPVWRSRRGLGSRRLCGPF